MSYLKVGLAILLFIMSFFILFQGRLDMLTSDEYSEELFEVINGNYSTEELKDEAIDDYLDSVIQIDGKYIKVTSNWREGTYYLLGSVLIMVFVIDDVLKNRGRIESKSI